MTSIPDDSQSGLPEPRADDEALVLRLEARIAKGKGAEAFAELFARFKEEGSHTYHSVDAMMSFLQSLHETRPAAAAYLMARLIQPAQKYLAHESTDSIKLYLFESTDLEVAAALTRLSREAVRPLLSKMCLRFAELIDARASR
jgi:hypothetical protein